MRDQWGDELPAHEQAANRLCSTYGLRGAKIEAQQRANDPQSRRRFWCLVLEVLNSWPEV